MDGDFSLKRGVGEDIWVLWTPLGFEGPGRSNGEFAEDLGDLRVPEEGAVIFATGEEEVVIAIAPTYGQDTR